MAKIFYDPIANNCEQFVTWCITGDHQGAQAAAGGSAAGAAAGAAGPWAAVGGIGAFGAAFGFSGPGIMAGLAAVGGVVGGGALAGIGVVAAAPAVAVAGVLSQTKYKTNPGQPESEQTARVVGTAATASAGVVGQQF